MSLLSGTLFDETESLFELNPSKLQCYLDCARQYRFRYLDKRRERRPSGPTALGLSVHKALRDLYALAPKDRSEDRLLKGLRRAWDGTGYRSSKEAEDAFARAEDMLRRYHAGADPAAARVVALESKFSHARSSDGILVTGRVDRLDMDGDEYVIIDYKTGRFGADDIVLNESLPLSLYAIAVSAVFGKDVHRIAIEHLSSGRRAETRRLPERLVQDWTKITDHASNMRTPTGHFPPRPAARCKWCDYLVACPEGRAAIRVPNAPEDDVPPLLDEDLS